MLSWQEFLEKHRAENANQALERLGHLIVDSSLNDDIVQTELYLLNMILEEEAFEEVITYLDLDKGPKEYVVLSAPEWINRVVPISIDALKTMELGSFYRSDIVLETVFCALPADKVWNTFLRVAICGEAIRLGDFEKAYFWIWDIEPPLGRKVLETEYDSGREYEDVVMRCIGVGLNEFRRRPDYFLMVIAKESEWAILMEYLKTENKQMLIDQRIPGI